MLKYAETDINVSTMGFQIINCYNEINRISHTYLDHSIFNTTLWNSMLYFFLRILKLLRDWADS